MLPVTAKHSFVSHYMPKLGSLPQLANLTATPNRPTVTNTAETTQFGVLEIEFGISSAARQQSLQGLLKFGLLREVELDWAGNSWQHDASVHYGGVSDNYAGFRW